MKTKKIVALLLAMTMVATVFVGCGNQNQEANESEEVKTSESESKEISEESPDVSEEPEEPTKLRIMINGLADVYEGSIGDQWVTQLEEELNLDIEWVIPPSSAYEDNLQLALINDNKPDVFCFPTEWLTQTSFVEACEAGMFYDLSGMIGDYENLMAHTGDVSWDALNIFNDGRIWGIPRSTVCRADGFMIREDWLKNLNIDYTEGELISLDEFYDLLYAFTYDDPDGNGADDTWGIGLYANADGSLNNPLSRIFHIGSGDSWYEMENGEAANLKYSKDYDYYKQCLEFTNKCWEAGVIEPDAFALNKSAYNERKANYGIAEGFPDSMDVTVTDTSPQTYVYCPGVIVDGDPIGTYTYGDYSTGIWYYYAISSTCENPEKFLELADYVLSDEQWVNLNAKNLLDVGFTIDAEGNYDFTLTDEIKAKDKEKGTTNADAGVISYFLRRSDGAEFFVNKSLPRAQQDRIAELINICFDLYWPAVDRGYKPEIATDPVFVEYKNYMIQEEAKIIAGDKPIEYWDEILNGFYEAGYDKYTEEMTTYIKTFN